MGEFFSKVSGQFTASLVLSALFPVALFLTALALVVLPISPFGHDLTTAVQDPKYWQDHAAVALVATLVVLTLSVVLYHLNTAIIQLYEGYPWRNSAIGTWCVRREQRRHDEAARLQQRIERLRLEARLVGADPGVPNLALVQEKLIRAGDIDRHLILPTRLGNTIRAFEIYPQRQYAIDAVSVWPRLQAIVDGNLAQALDSVKTSFDFMIHGSFLAGVLAIVTCASGLYWKTADAAALGDWLPQTAGFGLVAYLLYLASLRRAVAWGAQVKTAFDLHRLTLLAKLGYDAKPASLADERRIWENVNYKLLFAGELTYPDLPYAASPSAVSVEPAGTVVAATRGVAIQSAGRHEITLRIENRDPMAWDAARVVVREQVPAGMAYVPGATVDGAPATLRSVDPLVIDLGPLANNASKTLVYRVAKAAP
jgi:hypothetical protein